MKSLPAIHRLIAPLVCLTAAYTAEASVVVDFNQADDLGLFRQSSNFWSAAAGAGLDGSNGLVGPNTGTAGWMVYQQGFSAQSTSFSGGVFFKLAAPTSESSGYSIFFGVGGSGTYSPNVGNVVDEAKNHYAGVLQYTSSAGNRRFRLATHVSTEGAVSNTTSEYRELPFDSWYFLGIASEFNTETSGYSLTVTLYEANSSGDTGAVLLTAEYNDFTLPGLSGANENFAFFGIDGRSGTRGIAALDNFTYAPIPEGSSLVYLSSGVAALLWLRRR